MKKDQQFYTYGSNKDSVMHAICDTFRNLNIKNTHYVCNDPTSIFFTYNGEVYCAKKEDEMLQWMILNNPIYKKLVIKLDPKFKIGDSIGKIGESKMYTISSLDTKIQIYHVTDGSIEFDIPFEDQDEYGMAGEYFKLYDFITDGEIFGSVEKIDRLNKMYHIKNCVRYGQTHGDVYISFSQHHKWRKAIVIRYDAGSYFTGDILKYNNEYVTYYIDKKDKPGQVIVKTFDGKELTVYNDDLKPILVTDYILLQNGFKLYGIHFVNKYKGHYLDLSKENETGEYIVNANMKIKYFHELQKLYKAINWTRQLIL